MGMEPRACRAEELPALVRLANAVFRSGGSGDMAAEYPLVFDCENLDGLRIISDQRGPVAHVGVCIRDAHLLGARLRVASIGAVCTDPAHRGQGLASVLMSDARRFARDRGASLMLISGGRGLYHRLGYVTVGRFLRYRMDSSQLNGAESPEVELGSQRMEEIPRLAGLYQNEPVRFLRSGADWRRLLQAAMLMNAAADLVTIHHDGRLIAYVGAQRPNSDAPAADRVVRVQEMAGARRAIIAALPLLLRRYDASAVTLAVQPTDFEFAFAAKQHDWTPTVVAFPGTLGVIDPPAFMGAIQPLLDERSATVGLTIHATEEGAVFTLGAQRYEVAAPGPLAALLFGGETEEAQSLPRCEGRLAQVLCSLFPLPLLWYGYNYV
jgi:predicted N-acetyltransferase YhbS